MEIAVKLKPPFLGLNSKLITHKHSIPVCVPNIFSQRGNFCIQKRDNAREFSSSLDFIVKNTTHLYWKNHRSVAAMCALSPDLEDVGVSTSPFEGVSVASSPTHEVGEIKVRIDVSGAKSQDIFDNVFSKMVAAAQPIPGFKRVKGGKTPNIPRDILLEVLGPSKVYKQVIKKIINTTVAEYVEKENLKVTKDLRVEQSLEELEANFEPGVEFSFDAVIKLQ